ncbi:MAG: hypothetical protein HeimC2_42240 [Candidatus Heimdallarchaeota archaeon LC_2]|nr:MAG: hypothetical protein HeimC2_42240 [Candidatus Heimdallarchaeota archaeon LC_2]
METVHIILGNMVEQLLPIVVKSYSINLIISIGKPNLETPLFEIHQLDEFDYYKDDITDIREIVNKLLIALQNILPEKSDRKKFVLFVCVSSEYTKESLMMQYLSQALNCVSYYLEKSVLIELYPYRIETISPLEFKVLELIFKAKRVDSLKELLDAVDLNETDYTKATAKMGYVINKLSRANFVERSKDGRSVQVRITPQGEQHLLLFSSRLSEQFGNILI